MPIRFPSSSSKSYRSTRDRLHSTPIRSTRSRSRSRDRSSRHRSPSWSRNDERAFTREARPEYRDEDPYSRGSSSRYDERKYEAPTDRERPSRRRKESEDYSQVDLGSIGGDYYGTSSRRESRGRRRESDLGKVDLSSYGGDVYGSWSSSRRESKRDRAEDLSSGYSRFYDRKPSSLPARRSSRSGATWTTAGGSRYPGEYENRGVEVERSDSRRYH